MQNKTKNLIKPFSILIPLFFLTIANHCYGATYYVSTTQGNDSNVGTSETTPWKTIAKVNATKFIPGDKILFKGGETWNEQLNITSSGIASSPITYSSYGSGKAIFKGLPCGILIGNPAATLAVSDITISNLEITGSHWGIFAHGSRRNVEISNNYIHDLTAAGREEELAVEQYSNSVTAILFTHTQSTNSYLIIKDNLIENGLAITNTTAGGKEQGKGAGIFISTDSKKSLIGTSIFNNTINRVGGSGIALQYAKDAKIYDNKIYKSCQYSGGTGGIALGGGENHEVYNNYIEDAKSLNDTWFSTAGIQTFDTSHSKYYNNTIINSNLGIHTDSSDGNPQYNGVESHYNELHHNIIYNSMMGIMIEQENDFAKIYNNTLVNNGWANLSFRGGMSYLTNDCIVKNNILYSDSLAKDANNHVFEITNLGFNNVFNNNLYYLKPGITIGTFIDWPAKIGVPAINDTGVHYSMSQFSTYKSVSQQDVNSVNVDPLFTDPANGNFTPLPNSPLCGKGDPVYGNDIGAIPCADTPTCELQGDIDCNSQVNSQDIQLAINIFLGTENDAIKKTRADLNSDNTVNVQDIQKIINIVLGIQS